MCECAASVWYVGNYTLALGSDKCIPSYSSCAMWDTVRVWMSGLSLTVYACRCSTGRCPAVRYHGIRPLSDTYWRK